MSTDLDGCGPLTVGQPEGCARELSVPSDQVDDDARRTEIVADVDLASCRKLDDDQVGHRLPGDEVEVGGDRRARSVRPDYQIARRGRPVNGDVEHNGLRRARHAAAAG